jgi:hypothetical protein
MVNSMNKIQFKITMILKTDSTMTREVIKHGEL